MTGSARSRRDPVPGWRPHAGPPWDRVLLTVFAAVVTVNVVTLATGPHAAAPATKPLLMPALAAHAAARGGPRGLLGALACGWAGDLLLEAGGTAAFMAGMACFAAGHVCYLRLFARRGAFTGPRRAVRSRLAAYGAVWAVMVILLWPGLDAGLRGPVAGYSLLLTAMAAGSYGLGRTAALGGALFLLSDTLIATGLADWPQPPGHEAAIMLTYAVGQALLVTGVLRTPHGAGARSGAYRGNAPAHRPARLPPTTE